jgi:hypothetical protein
VRGHDTERGAAFNTRAIISIGGVPLTQRAGDVGAMRDEAGYSSPVRT